MDWQPIETAPKDGTVVRVSRVVDGERLFVMDASWREATFPPFSDAASGLSLPEENVTGWMAADMDKRAPTPTHWHPVEN